LQILTRDSPTQLWQELVREGGERARATLDEDLESYLVFTLMRHLGDAPLAHRVMALELLEALLKAGRRREQELRDVGDRCLLIAGLYPELAQRRHVPLRYFLELGQGAYDALGCELRAALAQLYAQLARAFSVLVRVLLEVRKLSGEWGGLAPLERHALLVRSDGTLEPDADAAFGAAAIVIAGNERTRN
jgi:hypothetical protein